MTYFSKFFAVQMLQFYRSAGVRHELLFPETYLPSFDTRETTPLNNQGFNKIRKLLTQIQ